MDVLNIKNADLVVNKDSSILLRNINLTVKTGEIVLLSGVNGSGKSTLLKALLSFSTTDDSEYAVLKSGTVLFCGEKSLKDISTKIIYIDQKDDPGKEYRIAEKVLLDGIPDFVKNKKEYLYNWLTKYDALTKEDVNGIYNDNLGKKDKPILKKRFMALSGGQKKWICILQGILKSEIDGYKIALIDEPLNNLDARHIKQFNNLLLRILDKHPDFCFLIISHCHAFTKISKLYEINENELINKEYQTHNCFGAYDGSGYYKI